MGTLSTLGAMTCAAAAVAAPTSAAPAGKTRCSISPPGRFSSFVPIIGGFAGTVQRRPGSCVVTVNTPQPCHRRMRGPGRLSFETGALHPPQDEAELAQHFFLTLRRPRSGRLEGRGPGVAAEGNFR